MGKTEVISENFKETVTSRNIHIRGLSGALIISSSNPNKDDG